MIRLTAKYLLFTALIALVICVLMGLKFLLFPTHYFPYLDIAGPESTRIKVLQRGQAQYAQCERTVAVEEAAIHKVCPSCRVETSGCLTDLDAPKKRWLGEESIALHSARMAYGVIVFESPQKEVALGACQESEKQSMSNALISRVKCFPAETKRPLLNIEQRILEREQLEKKNSLEIILALTLGLIVIVVTSFAFLNSLAVRAPLEDQPIGADTDQIAVFKVSNILKRTIDIVIAATLLIALSPILLLVAVLIRIVEGAPILYASRRLTSATESVTIFKFRTMVKDATSSKYRLRERFMRDGYLDIPLTCEVYTPIGRLLERSQLVETLQLLNIIFNGMSFVGNRPLPKENIELLKTFVGWQERFDSPAGITGISQITGKYDLEPQQRLYLERMYASIYKNPNGNIILCDIYIIAYTAFLLLTGRYLDYRKAVELLIRCGSNTSISEHSDLARPVRDSDSA
jgi:lipopolysaccharide/colanic/teichoic acid biosynthesis glycosyltransferase